MGVSGEVRYELYYWPSIQGRGEFVRLAFEEAGVNYVDVARLPSDQGGGVSAMMRVMQSERLSLNPFAPPFLRTDELVIAQTANILQFLGARLRLLPEDEAGRLAVHQLALTVLDLVFEVHESHHPIAVGLYYEDQRAEAEKRSLHLVQERLPKFLGYFERVLSQSASGGKFLVGSEVSYADLCLFQLISGLLYAFPNAMVRLAPKLPRCHAHAQRIAARPNLAVYLASERRIPFNEDGIFRRYLELDPP